MIRRRFMNGGVEELPYLTIESLEDGLTASLSTNACQYSTDGLSWTRLAAGRTTPAINTGEKLYFKASGLTPSTWQGIGTFTVSKKFNLSGNCNSMLFGDDAATNLDLTGYNRAFYYLFLNCTTLQSISKTFLPATTLVDRCYARMFQGCTSLTAAPELPATTLAKYCYNCMFYGCTSLITAPSVLPATTLAEHCYSSMFDGCKSLTAAPELPATTLADSCYFWMFRDCSALTTAPELPATTLANSCYSEMFSNTNVLPDCTNIDFSSSTVVQSGGLKGLFHDTKITDSDLRSILPINPYSGNYWLPVTTLANWCYQNMFAGCTALTTAPELPATTLANSCYTEMFAGCKSLTAAPELPATTLAYGCYQMMFSDCTKLTAAPSILPATTLAGRCYSNMFYDCTSLTTAPDLPATTLANYCYEYMFQNCTALTTAPELPATTLAGSCYGGMFQGCTSLTTAPELPATTLANSCYREMFDGCTKLNYIKMLATDISEPGCLSGWVYGVSSTGTFVKNAAATWTKTGTSGIPSGWTVETATA